MSYIKPATIFFSFFLTFSLAAGHRNGNGGGGLVCGNFRSPETVLLLDFWEGSVIYKIDVDDVEKIKTKPFDTDGQPIVGVSEVHRLAYKAIDKITKINASIGDFTRVEFNKIWKSVVTKEALLHPLVAIAPPEDARNWFFRRGCPLKGIALFNDSTNKLYLDSNLYPRLRYSHRAGLLVHESVYKVFRTIYKVADSISTRIATACAFTKEEPCENFDKILSDPSKVKKYFKPKFNQHFFNFH